MRLGVIGSRKFTNYTQMVKYLAKKGTVDLVVTGDSEGADQLAKEYAQSHNIPFEFFPQDKEAIVNNSDIIIAFWDGKSEGTQDILRLAKRAGKRIEIVFLEKKLTEAPFGYFVL
ncbi:MAG: hypothetical protein ACNS60_06985 [Candidatus Cyclobacteriaceae bacterium M2_1C_046]